MYAIAKLVFDHYDRKSGLQSISRLINSLGYEDFYSGRLELDRCVYWGNLSPGLKARFVDLMGVDIHRIDDLLELTKFQLKTERRENSSIYFMPHIAILTELYLPLNLLITSMSGGSMKYIELPEFYMDLSEEDHKRLLLTEVHNLTSKYVFNNEEVISFGKAIGFVFQPTLEFGYWLDEGGNLYEETGSPGWWPQPTNEWKFCGPIVG